MSTSDKSTGSGSISKITNTTKKTNSPSHQNSASSSTKNYIPPDPASQRFQYNRPALLNVCKLLRYEALKTYRTALVKAESDITAAADAARTKYKAACSLYLNNRSDKSAFLATEAMFNRLNVGSQERMIRDVVEAQMEWLDSLE
ncbi:uncharacterized protein CLAFUR5_14002 [Fulvia fulva]|uniref:Uncharacterized protein n=1 Tax=Passalora fulva TaxID=5499 RepID=A0A9Q8UW92_PASFU|nr:uncharacterized protein CLAFUR5_14002 [Fulvia fulva]KAK4611311.1 hypothetical protein CLAFUR0_14176 [Fulvia fulva]UJO24804.1 hypothetical protein CLAFUR5_14002 [Fulvia fulva]